MHMFWRLLLLLFTVFWFVPRVLRGLTGKRGGMPPRSGSKEHGPERSGRRSGGQHESGQNGSGHLANLTRQDISDAEFEEIPPPQ